MAIRSKYQESIRALLDHEAQLTESEQLTRLMLEPLGKGPLEPEPTKRPPYDELYLKQRYDRELWRRS